MAFKLTISDLEGARSYKKELSGQEMRSLVGKRIGETFRGEALGLAGYELRVTGGTDKDGFPMRGDVAGAARKGVLMAGPPGYHPLEEGVRRRKSVRGNMISEATIQVNAKVTKAGKAPLESLLGGGAAEKAEGEAEEKPKKGKVKKEGAAEKAE